MKNNNHFIVIEDEEDEDDDLFSLYQRASDKEVVLLEEEEEEDIRFCDISQIGSNSTLSEKDDLPGIIPQNLSFEQQNYQFPIHYSDDNIENNKIVFFGNETVSTSCSYSSMSTSIDLNISTHTTESHKVVLKLSKNQCKVIYDTKSYNDDDVDELESQCTFYPLPDNEEEEYRAATKIQAVWRGYQFRKQTKKSNNTNNNVIIQLFLSCGRFHQKEISQFSKKIDILEHRIKEEQAMRVAFETTMENLTELIDQQQKMLYDRLDHQTNMRRSCEKKMKQLVENLDPLHNKLKKETQARKKLELKMNQILDELRDTKERVVLSQQDDDDRKKKKNDHSKRNTRVSSVEKYQQQTMVLSSSPKTSRRSIIPERPSVVPSRRHPIDSINYKTKRLNQA